MTATLERPACVEITREHVDWMAAVAKRLAAGSTVRRLVDEDDLISQSLVVLWELALRYDPDTEVPFMAYLAVHARFRLIDYLRITYGRPKKDGSGLRARGQAYLQTCSLLEEDLDCNPAMVSTDPSVEEIVLARDEVARLGAYLRSGELTELQVRCLTWPAADGSQTRMLAETGVTEARAAAQRMLAKERAARHLDRTLRKHNGGRKPTSVLARP